MAVEADSGNVVAESDETDNGDSVTVTVLPPLLPDYQLTGSYTIPAQPLVGQNLKVVVPVGNYDALKAIVFIGFIVIVFKF